MNENSALPVLELKKLCFSYHGKVNPVIRNLDFSLHAKQKIGIYAPNGSGKSTLFHLIMGLLKARSGEIVFRRKSLESESDFQEMRKYFGLLFQDSDDQLFCPTVLEDVAFGPLNLGLNRNEAIAVSRATLRILGLEGFEHRITHKLSGGEKRLVALATILSMSPQFLLLDEPGTGLDQETSARLIHLLKEMDHGYLIISHNRDFLNQTAERQYGLKDGRLAPINRI
jgi:cobalt/nickel transport system ATP-binding protein